MKTITFTAYILQYHPPPPTPNPLSVTHSPSYVLPKRVPSDTRYVVKYIFWCKNTISFILIYVIFQIPGSLFEQKNYVLKLMIYNYFDQQTRIHPLLPYGIMSIGAFVAAMLCLTLPETKDQPTAELVRNGVNDVAVKELKDDLDREDEKMEFTSRL